MMVDIYESLDSIRNHEHMINTERQQELQHTGSVSVKNRRHRAVQVCLWLLCVLLLTAVIVLCVYFTSDRKHLTHKCNLTEEREKILTEYTEILNQNRNLTEERAQMKNKTDELQDDLTHNHNLTKAREKILIENNETLNQNRNLTEEREQMKNKTDELQDDLTHNYNLTKEREKLPNDVKELNTWHTEDLNSNNSDKWIKYNFSFYYISSEEKSWTDSREDCKERGADLVIINSIEEQEFMQNATAGYGFNPFWIGLRKEEGLWKWIDETTLKTSFWIDGYPRSDNHYCARTSSSGWSDFSCDAKYGWICEKRI
ncbi:asialoglycoprotein receptor 1-like [Triplophysa dalaica]|uniref:asialoglycoprotein receptor 1-like n=1 Tax=Triplophysa dalaica TaxID=1582913 RepID=UPI0024E03586|nr:asialoglycoprotein receptor 1-like [Triplophysa dalaica]